MQHFYTYPTVTPLPRDRLRPEAYELDADRHLPQPELDHPMTGGARPRLYASASSGGTESTAS